MVKKKRDAIDRATCARLRTLCKVRLNLTTTDRLKKKQLVSLVRRKATPMHVDELKLVERSIPPSEFVAAHPHTTIPSETGYTLTTSWCLGDLDTEERIYHSISRTVGTGVHQLFDGSVITKHHTLESPRTHELPVDLNGTIRRYENEEWKKNFPVKSDVSFCLFRFSYPEDGQFFQKLNIPGLPVVLCDLILGYYIPAPVVVIASFDKSAITNEQREAAVSNV